MMGEPWCYTPEEVAQLTDVQIWHLYIDPAVERSKQMQSGGASRSRSGTGAGSDGPPGEPGSAEHRGACVNAFMSIQGLSRERAEDQYARQLEQWNREQGV